MRLIVLCLLQLHRTSRDDRTGRHQLCQGWHRTSTCAYSKSAKLSFWIWITTDSYWYSEVEVSKRHCCTRNFRQSLNQERSREYKRRVTNLSQKKEATSDINRNMVPTTRCRRVGENQHVICIADKPIRNTESRIIDCATTSRCGRW